MKEKRGEVEVELAEARDADDEGKVDGKTVRIEYEAIYKAEETEKEEELE